MSEWIDKRWSKRRPSGSGTRAWCIAAGLLLAACSGGPAGPDPTPAGVDLAVLFAPPTADEIQAIREEWAIRQPEAHEVRLETTFPAPVGSTPATARVVSHVVDGNRHYGAVLAPDEGGPRPVLILLHGGDDGASLTTADVQLLVLALGEVADDFVYAIPSFRSEPLVVEGREFRSEGEPSPWDRDVDDAIAFLDAVLATTPGADPDRVAAIGFSRGALVGLLMAIRDPRVDRVVEMMGPTDFFDEYVRELVVEALEGRPRRDLPGFAVLDQRFLQPLARGALTEADVRPELVRRSAVLFAAELPALQVHHGTADEVVAISQARSLVEAMERLGRGPPEFEAFIYQGGRHDVLSLPGALDRAREFVSRMSRILTLTVMM